MSRVVFKLGGSAALVSAPRARELHVAGHEVVVVHGAGFQITAELHARGIPVIFVRGRRFTYPATLALVRASLVAVGAELSAALGPAASHLVGDAIGLEAEPIPELGLVGEPRPWCPDAVVAALDAGRIPVVTPIAVGPLNGLDALLATAQVPGGVPVAAVGIDNVKNAALLAIRILKA